MLFNKILFGDVYLADEHLELVQKAQVKKQSKGKKGKKAKKRAADLGTFEPEPVSEVEVGEIHVRACLSRILDFSTIGPKLREGKENLSEDANSQTDELESETSEARKRRILQDRTGDPASQPININLDTTVQPSPPTVLQIYLHLHSAKHVQARSLEFLSEENRREMDLKRNLYVRYKTFPEGKEMKTETQWRSSDPEFRHRSQFPVVLNGALVEKMENFCFMFEMWDTLSPNKDEIVGYCK